MNFVKSFARLAEAVALVRFKFLGYKAFKSKCDYKSMSPSLRQCYDLLSKTSTTYADTIQQMAGEHRDVTCVFFLMLRSLDTVEDDMTIPNNVKVPMLKNFYKNLEDPDWRYMESKDKDRIVLENFPSISKAFQEFEDSYKEITIDICQRVGDGLTVFLDREIVTVEDWDEYCYYAGSLAAQGLARNCSASGKEDKIVGEDLDLASKLGNLYQKANMIRDFLEDFHEGRIFWPKAIWSKYVSDVGDLAKPENRDKAVQCLNELVTNALELVPQMVLFLSRLSDQSNFNFFAVSTARSLSSLARCYDNPNVFTRTVKIRQGEAVRIIMAAESLEKTKAIVQHYILEVIDKIPESDPNSGKTRAVCQRALEAVKPQQEYSSPAVYIPLYGSLGLLLSIVLYICK